MPEMTPVATQIQPPNPGAGLGMLSSILKLKQQQQNLQTGQYRQQQAAAESSQAQQQNSELQALGQFTANAAKDPSYLNPDGTPNVQKYQQGAMAVAPVYGQAYIGQMTSNFNAGVENRQALLNLNADERSKAAGFFKAVATGSGDFDTAVENARALSTDPILQKALDRVLRHAPQTAMMTDAQAATAMQKYAGSVASQIEGAAQQTPSSIDTGGTVQPGATNVYTGQFTPSGVPVVKTIAPGQTRNSAGNIVNVAPVSGALSFPGTASSQVNPASPTVAAQTGMAQDDNSRYAQISQEGTNAQTGAQLADEVATLAQEVRTGQLSKEWTDRLTVLRQHDPSLTARQMLSKYAAQLKTMAEHGASTDASRSQIEQGMPSPESMGPDAVAQAAQYVGGIFRMRGARQAYADQYVKNAGGTPIGIRGADDSFMSAADPTVFAYNALPSGAQRQQFLKERFGNDPQKIRAFVARVNQVKHYAGAIQ